MQIFLRLSIEFTVKMFFFRKSHPKFFRPWELPAVKKSVHWKEPLPRIAKKCASRRFSTKFVSKDLIPSVVLSRVSIPWLDAKPLPPLPPLVLATGSNTVVSQSATVPGTSSSQNTPSKDQGALVGQEPGAPPVGLLKVASKVVPMENDTSGPAPTLSYWDFVRLNPHLSSMQAYNFWKHFELARGEVSVDLTGTALGTIPSTSSTGPSRNSQAAATVPVEPSGNSHGASIPVMDLTGTIVGTVPFTSPAGPSGNPHETVAVAIEPVEPSSNSYGTSTPLAELSALAARFPADPVDLSLEKSGGWPISHCCQ